VAGAAGEESPPGTSGATSTAPGTEAASARTSAWLGGAVGGDEGIAGMPGTDCTPGTPGKENMSLVRGNDRGEFKGPAFPSVKSADHSDAVGHDGAPPGTSGTSAVVLASEAGSARRSASVTGLPTEVEGEEGMDGISGGGAPGTPGIENTSPLAGGRSRKN
jgi:hypothetical protein